MSNVIIFTDIVPKNIGTGDDPWFIEYSAYSAGAYAVASHLRSLGFSVTVMPHCASLTLTGVKQLIDNNSKDLVWVGLSTSLFSSANTNIDYYRNNWHTSTDNSLSNYFDDRNSKNWVNKVTEMLWGSAEINQIAKYIGDKYNIPLLVGGGWVSGIANGNLSNLEKNIHIITGRAELHTEAITRALINKEEIPFNSSNNNSYDDVDFKNRIYSWTNQDLIDPTDWLPVEVARGCSFNCAFCNYDRKSTFDSYRNPLRLREELIKNYEEFGVTKFILMDDLYNDSKEKVRVLYDQVWSKLPFVPEWTSYMRLDMIHADPESAEILKNSGARMASFGIETLHHVAGRRVGKGLGKSRILDTLTMLKETWKDDVLMHGMFIMGLPDEPESSMLETIEWLHTNDLLYSHSTGPMWITPLSHQNFVVNINSIAKDNEKYGVTWVTDTNWINREGVTFERANELAGIANNGPIRIPISFAQYPEFRKMGFSHADIALFKQTGIDVARDHSPVLSNKIHQKVQKFLSLSDI